jgi:hypothetical protein
MNQHTPGPWKFDKEYGNAMDELYGPDGRAIAAVWTRRCSVATHVRECYKTDKEGAANIRLIAAAPELLEAMRECITDEDCRALVGEEYSDLERARRRLHEINRVIFAAIAKATGQ